MMECSTRIIAITTIACATAKERKIERVLQKEKVLPYKRYYVG